MVDPSARSALAAAMRGYLREELTAFQLDEALDKLRNSTRDETCLEVADWLWYSYDDIDDHRVIADKSSWDTLHRLLLLIESGAEWQKSPVIWSWGRLQALALLFFGIFLSIAVPSGWGQHLLILALPFGFVVVAINWAERRKEKQTASAILDALTPFSSLAELRQARLRVPGFVKMPLPQTVLSRCIRQPLAGVIMSLPSYILSAIFSPLILLLQSLPRRRRDAMIVFPEI